MRRRTVLVASIVFLVAVPSAASAHPDPLAPYHWVAPPPGAGATNIAPLGRTAELPVASGRLVPTDVWTGDLQAAVTLPAIRLPTSRSDAVSIAITPVDPASLATPLEGMHPLGNAYWLGVTDAGVEINGLDPPGRLLLTVPHAASRVLYSADGSRWEVVAAQSPSPVEVSTAFARTGYYLAASEHAIGGTSAATKAVGGWLIVLLGTPFVMLAVLLCNPRAHIE